MTTPFEYDVKYMRRALQLAANAPEDTHPNPMVGAVIVCDGRIIGEGWHRKCGQGHAEVNAVASVADESLLERSTMYVTLEPCSHYGKTPPCAKLLIDKKIPRVVIGAVDPNPKVAGRGVQMLKDAGIEVVTGVLAEESRALNEKFITAQTLRRPCVTIKWARSRDGFMDIKRGTDTPPYRFSTPLSTMLTHRERARHDAILTTAATFLADRPSLTTRNWSGPSPRRYIYDRSGGLINSGLDTDGFTVITGQMTIAQLLERIFDDGVTSLLIEAGPRFLQAVIDSGLWDHARIEISPVMLGEEGAHPAPVVPPNADHKCKNIS